MKHSPFQILFEDADIVVINKMPGVLSIADRFNPHLPSVLHGLGQRNKDVFAVHRLDRDTSGVIVFALNASAHKILNRQFEERSVSKLYHAVVSGVFREDELPVDIPMSANPGKKGLMMPTVRGKEALTIFRPIKRFRSATLLECDLRTGRQHQIRVHCSAIGFPLLVDPDYGENTDFRLSTIKRRYNLAKGTEERPIISRQTLHSHSITFTHPATGERVSYKAGYPKDFRALLQVLEKYTPYQEPASWEREWGIE